MDNLPVLIEKFFGELNDKRRIVIFFLLLIFSIFAFIGYERYTGHFFYLQINEKTQALKQIIEVKNIASQSAEISSASSEIIQLIRKKPVQTLDELNFLNADFSWLIKGFGASWLCLIPILTSIFPNGKDIDSDSKVRGIVGGLFGFPFFFLFGAIVPTFYSIWANVIGISIIEFFLLVVLGKIGQKLGKNKDSESSNLSKIG